MPGESVPHTGESDPGGESNRYATAAEAVAAFTRVVKDSADEIDDAARRINAAVLGIQTNPGRDGGGERRGDDGGGLGGKLKKLLKGNGVEAEAGEAAGAGAVEGAAEGIAAGGGLAAGFSAAATAAMKVAKGLNDLSDTQLRYNRQLAEASAAMAATFAQRDVQERIRNIEKGDRLTESARALTQAEQQREENRKEIDILTDRVKNSVAAGWERFKGAAFAPFNEMARQLNVIAENTGPRAKEEPILMGEWVQAIAEQDRRRREIERKLPPDVGVVKP
jgi:hypothetical protein